MATVKYEIRPGSEELCLTACYEESDCIFAEYFQDYCTLYINGIEAQASRGKLFEVNRVQFDSSCSRRIVVAPTVNFVAITPIQAASSPCKGEPSSVTAVNVFSVGDFRFYSTRDTISSDGLQPFRRLLFATDPQNACTSIPVFTRANHRRLSFGDVHRAPGYIFLNSYAFAEPCTCEQACCGKTEIKEFVRGAGNYVYRSPSETITPSDVNQIFYVVKSFKL
ncbi:hypothetical protein Aduo_014398 [Ancylostoma duodenale]